MTIWAILPAAGVGRRMESSIPKQYLMLAGKPVIQHSIEKLLQVNGLAGLVVVLHPEDSHFSGLSIAKEKIIRAAGGETRQQSVLNGLQAISDQAGANDWVLVHDAVRPCALVNDIECLLGSVTSHAAGGLLATPQDNTLKIADQAGRVEKTVDRSQYWQALTPQVFRYAVLLKAMSDAVSGGLAVTDEASAVEAGGYSPLLVNGDHNNIKLTRESDLLLAEAILSRQQQKQ